MLRYRDAFCASCTTWKIRGPAAAVSVDALIHNAPVYAVVDCECRLTITSTTLAKDATERGGNCRETARRAGLVETLLSLVCLQLLFLLPSFLQPVAFLSVPCLRPKEASAVPRGMAAMAWEPACVLWLGNLAPTLPKSALLSQLPSLLGLLDASVRHRGSQQSSAGFPSLCQPRAAGCCCDLSSGLWAGTLEHMHVGSLLLQVCLALLPRQADWV